MARSSMKWLMLAFAFMKDEEWLEMQRCLVAALEEEPNNPVPMYWLGHLCEQIDSIAESTGIPPDDLPFSFEDRQGHFERAARMGMSEAQYSCGRILIGNFTYGGAKTEMLESGIDWLRRAAAQAHGRAAMQLAELFRNGLRTNGEGTEANVQESLVWYHVAETAGVCKVKDVLHEWRARIRLQRCLKAVDSGDKNAFLYADWADRTQGPLLKFDTVGYDDESVQRYRLVYPDRILGSVPWWETPAELDYETRTCRN
jgi:hypothetical protein